MGKSNMSKTENKHEVNQTLSQDDTCETAVEKVISFGDTASVVSEVTYDYDIKSLVTTGETTSIYTLPTALNSYVGGENVSNRKYANAIYHMRENDHIDGAYDSSI